MSKTWAWWALILFVLPSVVALYDAENYYILRSNDTALSNVTVNGTMSKTITICQNSGVCVTTAWDDEVLNVSNITGFVRVNGDSMTGDLNMTNNNIWTVNILQVHNITGMSPVYIDAPIISAKNITAENFIGNVFAGHNNLSGLQGGSGSDYYHLSSSEHSDVQNLASTYYPLNTNPACVS